jgi:RNA polymerase sigma-70 factor (ECF subfamily)
VNAAETSSSLPENRRGRFETTHWSEVFAARQQGSGARAALESLCEAYWYPLYVFVRRQGQREEDAKDLVQEFFARCLEKNYFDAADQAKGRFRTFLLVALKRFMANEWDKARAKKRGGGTHPISLDAMQAEERYAAEPADRLSADKLFDRRWALTLLDRVLQRLEQEQNSEGKRESFLELKTCLAGDGDASYAELAEKLETTEGAVKTAVHRLRRRYRELLSDEISRTVSNPGEIEAERRSLLEALSA